MKISEVSKKFDISIQTLRYYEREELIPHVHRNAKGVRDYQESDLYWIYYVQALRHSGVSVASIKNYVKLVQQGFQTRDERKRILLEQKQELLKQRSVIDEALRHMNIKLGAYDTYVVELEKNTRRGNQQSD